MRLVVTSTFALLLAAPLAHAAPREPVHPFDVKPGMELTIPISIVDGKATAGVARLAPLGAGHPTDGEITIGLDRIKGVFYNQITVTEKTAQPIDFLVTGLNGGTKIDETEVCGRLDQPVVTRIGSVPWRFWVNGFEISKPGGCS